MNNISFGNEIWLNNGYGHDSFRKKLYNLEDPCPKSRPVLINNPPQLIKN